MFTLHFDCQKIHSRADFYDQLRQQYQCDSTFGCSLDALWDWLTGELPLPLTCHFHALQAQQLAEGEPLVAIVELLEEAKADAPELYHILIEESDKA